MNKFFFLCFVILALPSVGQTINTSSYLEDINTAELLIVDGKYKEAAVLFDSTLKNYKSPFAKDYYNGAICCILSGDKDKAIDYIEILLSKGMSISDISKNTVIASLQDSHYWKNLLKRSIKKPIKTSALINFSLKKKLDELYERDQYFRGLEGSYQKYGDTIRAVDKLNDKILHSIIEENGYPTEETVGIKENIPLINSDFDIVIWHQNKKNFISDYSDILMEAAKAGRIDPHRAAELIDNQVSKPVYNSTVFLRFDCDGGCSFNTNMLIKNKLFHSSLTPDQENAINVRRAAIGLEALSDYRKKALFSMKDNRFFFGYTIAVPVLSFAQEATLLSILNRFKAVDQ